MRANLGLGGKNWRMSFLGSIDSYSKLPNKQVRNHLPASNDSRGPQVREIKSAGKCVRVSEEEHWRDPTASIL